MNGKDILKAIVSSFEEGYSLLCTVNKINGSFCDCSPVDGSSDILGVKLQAIESKGSLIVPAIGSMVIVSFINRNAGYVSMFSKIDTITLLGGNFNGLVKADELKTQLNKLKDTVDALVEGFSSWTPVPNDGGAALKTVMTTKLAAKTTGDFSKLRNDKIKHGDGG